MQGIAKLFLITGILLFPLSCTRRNHKSGLWFGSSEGHLSLQNFTKHRISLLGDPSHQYIMRLKSWQIWVNVRSNEIPSGYCTGTAALDCEEGISRPNKPWVLLLLRVVNEIPCPVASRSTYDYQKSSNMLNMTLKSSFLINKSLGENFFFFKYRPMSLLCFPFEGLWRCPSWLKGYLSAVQAPLQISLIMCLKMYVATPQSTAFNSGNPFASLQRSAQGDYSSCAYCGLRIPQHPSTKGKSSSPRDPAWLQGWMRPSSH